MASSPPSPSSHTHYGSPITNTTSMSPDHTTNSGSYSGTSPKCRLIVNPTIDPITCQYRQVHPLPIHIQATALSPSAATFTPALQTTFNGSTGATPTNGFQAQATTYGQNSTTSNSPAFPGVIGQGTSHFHGRAYAHIVTEEDDVIVDLADIRIAVAQVGTYSTDEHVPRLFAIIGEYLTPAHIAAAFYPLEFIGDYQLDARGCNDGFFTAHFTDVRDAKQAFVLCRQMLDEYCDVMPLSPRSHAMRMHGSAADVTNYEGQIVASFNTEHLMRHGRELTMFDLMSMLSQGQREVKAAQTIAPRGHAVVSFRVEYYDSRAAHSILQERQSNMIVQQYAPDFGPHTPPFNSGGGLPPPPPPPPPGPGPNGHRYNMPSFTGGNQTSITTRLGTRGTLETYPIYHEHPRASARDPHLSLTGRSTLVPGEDDAYDGAGFRSLFPAIPATPATQTHASRDNHVDVGRILRGQDVRTTIMLRNIPNKINQAALKALIDQTSLGTYDFMYLRIDFANNCNVGYAFINFVDAYSIIGFAQARQGQRWNVFNSDKVAEISYATIQGRDCLIQKFRNSSVMLERSSFRPKLFVTGSGPDAGREESFPGPDNEFKLRRSCENAETIGLFRSSQQRQSVTPTTLQPLRNQSHAGQHLLPARSQTTNLHTTATENVASTRAVEAYMNRLLATVDQRMSLDNPTSQSSRRVTPPRSTQTSNSLYAPREGQAQREQLRRHNSQFDRGTLGAQYEASVNNMTSSNSPLAMSQAFSNLAISNNTNYGPLRGTTNALPGHNSNTYQIGH